MKILKLISNNSGFDLIEVMVAFSMLAIISTSIMSLTENYHANQRVSSSKDAVQTITNSVIMAFSDHNTCTKNFIPGTVANPIQLRSSSELIYNSGTAILSSANNPNYLKQGFQFNGASLVYTSGQNFAQLKLDFNITLKGGNNLSQSKWIYINMSLNASGVFDSCLSNFESTRLTTFREILRKACISPGFTFDSSDPLNPKCIASPTLLGSTLCPSAGSDVNNQQFIDSLEIIQQNNRLEYRAQCSLASPCNSNQFAVFRGGQINCIDNCSTPGNAEDTAISSISMYLNGAWRCINLMCDGPSKNSIEYLQGISQNGKLCRTIISPSTPCPLGKYYFHQLNNDTIQIKCGG